MNRKKESILTHLHETWNHFAKTDPLWSILADHRKKGNRWALPEFFATGEKEIEDALGYMKQFKLGLPRNKALDFGCGAGRLTQALAKHFDQVYGVDISPVMIEYANKYNQHGTRCHFYTNKENNLQLFNDCTFDLVYSRRVLQHIPPELAENYIVEFLRVARPGAIMIFQVPSEPARTLHGCLARVFTPWIFKLTSHFRLPIFESYTLQEGQVIELIERNGGRLLEARPDLENKYWTSFVYYVLKVDTCLSIQADLTPVENDLAKRKNMGSGLA